MTDTTNYCVACETTDKGAERHTCRPQVSDTLASTTTKAMDDKAEDSRMAWEVGRTEGVTFERARIRHELESLTHYYWLDDVKCYRVSDVLDVIGGKDA